MAHSGGAKLGNRIAHIVSQTTVVTHAKLLHVKHKLALMIFHSISDIISQEVHQSMDTTLSKLWEALPEDSPAKPLLGFMANETGQLQAGAGISMVAGSILGSIAQIINNELAPSVRGALLSNPHMLPDPGTLSQLAAKGLAAHGDVLQSIAEQGINQGWGTAMINANNVYPDPASALEMMRRGLISVDTFLSWCQLNAIPHDVAVHWAQLVHIALSPADAALAVLRGNMPYGEAVAVAAEYGLTQSDFDIMVGNTGEPPGPEQLLEANRRGFIDKARLAQGIAESRIRNDWLDVMEKLAFSPMSTADAVNAVVQNHLTTEQAAAIASQNGLEPGAFQTLVDTAGEPLSRTEMEQLFNRGLVTEAQVNQALDESRLKPKYNQLAFELHTRLLQPSELADMVMWGAISHANGVAEAMKLGYDNKGAAGLIDSAVNKKLESDRLTVIRAIEVLYQDNAISEADAHSQMARLGFSESEVSFKLQAAELKRHTRLINTGLTAIRSKFIAHHIDKLGASNAIDAMGIPHQQRDAMLQLWTIEQSANVAQLTEAQIIKALKNQTITVEDAKQRLLNKGYRPEDVTILIEDM
jgi:hypothetical protein